MGYLNKATITVDAILTNRGRELLAEGGTGVDANGQPTGQNAFRIAKFAVSDDEVDYSLYNDDHPNGSPYKGNVIENMPLLEATPDESQIMRYKLITIDPATETSFVSTDGTVIIPQVNFGLANSNTVTITVNTPYVTQPSTSTNTSENYTLLVANAELLNIYVLTAGNTIPQGTAVSNPPARINANGSITLPVQAGRYIHFTKQGTKTGTTTATLFGELTGATRTITITVS